MKKKFMTATFRTLIFVFSFKVAVIKKPKVLARIVHCSRAVRRSRRGRSDYKIRSVRSD